MGKSIWQELEIEPTSDVKAIKKAYAKKSRTVHPEEHPDEFSKLKKAYEYALDYAKYEAFNYDEDEYQISDEILQKPESLDSIEDDIKEFEDIRTNYQLNLASFEREGKLETGDETDYEYEFKYSHLDRFNELDTYQEYVCGLIAESAVSLGYNPKYKNNPEAWKYLFKTAEKKYSRFKLNAGLDEDKSSNISFLKNINVAWFFLKMLTEIPGLSVDVYQVFEQAFFPEEKDDDWQELYNYFSLKKVDISSGQIKRNKVYFLGPWLKLYIDRNCNYRLKYDLNTIFKLVSCGLFVIAAIIAGLWATFYL